MLKLQKVSAHARASAMQHADHQRYCGHTQTQHSETIINTISTPTPTAKSVLYSTKAGQPTQCMKGTHVMKKSIILR
jgi:hypothetical protein